MITLQRCACGRCEPKWLANIGHEPSSTLREEARRVIEVLGHVTWPILRNSPGGRYRVRWTGKGVEGRTMTFSCVYQAVLHYEKKVSLMTEFSHVEFKAYSTSLWQEIVLDS